MRYLLDTKICSYILKSRPASVKVKFDHPKVTPLNPIIPQKPGPKPKARYVYCPHNSKAKEGVAARQPPHLYRQVLKTTTSWFPWHFFHSGT